MALALAPVSENASHITCSDCPASLVVTTRISAVRLRLMLESVEMTHRCSAS